MHKESFIFQHSNKLQLCQTGRCVFQFVSQQNTLLVLSISGNLTGSIGCFETSHNFHKVEEPSTSPGRSKPIYPKGLYNTNKLLN